MRPGLVLTHFLALLLATSASLLLRAWSERDFPEAAASPGEVARVAPRCLALEVADTTALWIPLPHQVRLAAKPARHVPTLPSPAGWYDARATSPSGADTLLNRDGIDRGLRWRPAGPDSLDILIPGWPVGARLRVASHGDDSHGRLVGYGDAFEVLPFNGSLHIITWPPVYDVRATRVPCLSRHAGQRVAEPEQRT